MRALRHIGYRWRMMSWECIVNEWEITQDSILLCRFRGCRKLVSRNRSEINLIESKRWQDFAQHAFRSVMAVLFRWSWRMTSVVTGVVVPPLPACPLFLICAPAARLCTSLCCLIGCLDTITEAAVSRCKVGWNLLKRFCRLLLRCLTCFIGLKMRCDRSVDADDLLYVDKIV